MNLTPSATGKLIRDMAARIKNVVETNRISWQALENMDIVIAPSYTSLSTARAAINDVVREGIIPEGLFQLGAQDVSVFKPGARTGEESVENLKELGVSYVILGHSERRHGPMRESSELVKGKAKRAIEGGLTPIIAIGETLENYQEKLTYRVIGDQFAESTIGIDLRKIVVAYEPVWAIGTGRTPTPEEANKIQRFVRALAIEQDGYRAGASLAIQYGGSMKPDNVGAFIAQPNIDGGLIGNASLKAEDFIEIVTKSLEHYLSASQPSSSPVEFHTERLRIIKQTREELQLLKTSPGEVRGLFKSGLYGLTRHGIPFWQGRIFAVNDSDYIRQSWQPHEGENNAVKTEITVKREILSRIIRSRDDLVFLLNDNAKNETTESFNVYALGVGYRNGLDVTANSEKRLITLIDEMLPILETMERETASSPISKGETLRNVKSVLAQYSPLVPLTQEIQETTTLAELNIVADVGLGERLAARFMSPGDFGPADKYFAPEELRRMITVKDVFDIVMEKKNAASSPVAERRQSSDVPSTTLGTPFGRSRQLKTDDGRLTTNPGGIDLNPMLMDLQILRDGNGMPLPLAHAAGGEYEDRRLCAGHHQYYPGSQSADAFRVGG